MWVALVVHACAVMAVHASAPTFWEVATESEFLEGEVENLSIDSFGRVTLGPTTESVYETSAPFIWTIAAAADGAVFAGSGNGGQVFRMAPDGRTAVFFDAPELAVHALAPGPDGALYVGTSPNGKVYRVSADGSSEVVFDPEDPYIWSLALAGDGTLYVATGDKGVIYRIDPDGGASTFYETEATNVLALAFDAAGRLLAGTQSPGRVFRLDRDGTPFVLLDSEYAEVRALRLRDDGSLYVAAVRGQAGPANRSAPVPEPTPATVAPGATVSTEITVTAVAPAAASSPQSPPAAGAASGSQPAGAVFRILPDGVWDTLWESQADAPYDVAVDDGGNLLVATGNSGKIYRLDEAAQEITLVTRVNASQITGLLTRPGTGVLLATSNPGKLLRLSGARASRGLYTSPPRDARTVALWGTIRWRAVTPDGTRVEVSTRSGNTARPDDTWSPWSDPYDDPDGSQIVSPRARYLQWRAVFSGGAGDAPMLTSVGAAYLPRNVRPRVTSVTVHPAGTVFREQFPADPPIAGFDGVLPGRLDPQAAAASRALGRRAYEQGLLTFVWRAEDANDDELRYSVRYRREGEASWRALRENLTETILVWDTGSVPNGRYSIRVEASDAPSNPAATALVGSRESASFEVDNVPPVVTVTSVQRDGDRMTIAFDVRDAQSGVRSVDYSLDGDRWQAVYPTDGIADSRFEQFELVIERGADVGEVTLRAMDALNNAGSATSSAGPPSGGR